MIDMMGRHGRCELGDTLLRLFLHCIDGKKMWGGKWVMRGKRQRRDRPKPNLHLFAKHLFAFKTITGCD
jgi:hypothetical protein